VLEFSLRGKWIDLLKQAAPGLMRVVFMYNPEEPLFRFFLPAAEAAAPSIGVEVTAEPVRSTVDIEYALMKMASAPASGLALLGDPSTALHIMLIADLGRRHRLPAIRPRNDFARDGGLMAYGPGITLEGHFQQSPV
jgi:putative tryptophan/tyrosine transport system substrate-binding protein